MSDLSIVEVTLKPCPFCGATAHRGLMKVEHCQLHGEPFQRYAIWCPKNHARIEAMSEGAARTEWNTRASTASEAEATSLQKTQTTAERVREACANTGYQVCAETRHVTLGEKVRAAIRSLPIGGVTYDT